MSDFLLLLRSPDPGWHNIWKIQIRVCGITAENSIARGTQALKLNVLCLAQKNDFNIRNVSIDGSQTFRYL